MLWTNHCVFCSSVLTCCELLCVDMLWTNHCVFCSSVLTCCEPWCVLQQCVDMLLTIVCFVAVCWHAVDHGVFCSRVSQLCCESLCVFSFAASTSRCWQMTRCKPACFAASTHHNTADMPWTFLCYAASAFHNTSDLPWTFVCFALSTHHSAADIPRTFVCFCICSISACIIHVY